MSQIKNVEKIFKIKKVIFQNVRRVDFKAGALYIFYRDSLYKQIKGIPQIRK